MANTNSQRMSVVVIAIVFLFMVIALPLLAVFASNDSDSTQEQTSEAPTEQAGCGTTTIEPVQAETPEVYTTQDPVTELQVTDIKTGEGDEVQLGDCIQVLYQGTLAKTGAEFDGNFATGQPVEFSLVEGGLIQGWIEGIPGMRVGGVRRLVIPAEMAYGSQDNGEQLPANSDLVFVVQLTGINTELSAQ